MQSVCNDFLMWRHCGEESVALACVWCVDFDFRLADMLSCALACKHTHMHTHVRARVAELRSVE